MAGRVNFTKWVGTRMLSSVLILCEPAQAIVSARSYPAAVAVCRARGFSWYASAGCGQEQNRNLQEISDKLRAMLTNHSWNML